MMWYIIFGLILVLAVGQDIFEYDNTVRDILISILVIMITVLLWPLWLLIILIIFLFGWL